MSALGSFRPWFAVSQIVCVESISLGRANSVVPLCVLKIFLLLQERRILKEIEGFLMLNGSQSPVLFRNELCHFRKHFRSSRSVLATATALFQHTECSLPRAHVMKLGLTRVVPPP